ncbi:MAG: hypothetical protein D6775_03820 [Caldilineae bacterium]|nr:MAG: hypothetical protein D6775_03820 [Caldilineae bacterium]
MRVRLLFLGLSILLFTLACGQGRELPGAGGTSDSWQTFAHGDFSVRLPAWPQAASDDNAVIHSIGDGTATLWIKPWPLPPRLVGENLQEWAQKNEEVNLVQDSISPGRATFELTIADSLYMRTLLVYCAAQSFEITLAAPRSRFEDYRPLLAEVEPACDTSWRPPRLARGAPGMVIVPASGENSAFDPAAYQQALYLARQNGVLVSHYYTQWGEIEKAPGQYDWRVLDYIVEAHQLEDLQLSLVVNVIHTSVRGRVPPDLENATFADERFKQRLAAFAAALARRYAGRLHYLAIGNEVNNYFARHRDEVETYAQAFQQARAAVHVVNPDLPVGIVFAYHDAETGGTLDIVQRLNRGDYIAFTLYLFDEGYHFTRDPALFDGYVENMLNTAGPTPLAIVETGWSTAPELDGSEAAQAQYVHEIFETLRKRGRDILFLSWFAMHDSTPQTCQNQALSFFEPGQSPDPAQLRAFVSFLCYFGLRRADGTPKPAWHTWADEAERYYAEQER